MRRPSRSKRRITSPTTFLRTPSGLTMERVFSTMLAKTSGRCVLRLSEDPLDRFADLRGCLEYRHAGALERRHLFRGGPLAAGDDRSRVPHATTRRRGLTGDESDDRLLHLALGVQRRLFLGGAADLADQDDGAGVGVVLEQRQGIEEGGADDRITADADAGRLSDTAPGELAHRLVGQRA